MLSITAKTYITGVISLGVITFTAILVTCGWNVAPEEMLMAAVMSGLAVISQLGKVVYFSGVGGSRGTSWYTPLLSIMFAGALILSPQLIAVVVITPHLVELLLERARKTPFLTKWYIQPFNMATHLLCSLAAWGTFTAMRYAIALPLAGAAAALIYLALNHVLVGQVMVLACGFTWAQTGVWDVNNLLCDVAFLVAGLGTAALVAISLALAVPLVLVLLIGQRLVACKLIGTVSVKPA
jgi:hypothetical protein